MSHFSPIEELESRRLLAASPVASLETITAAAAVSPTRVMEKLGRGVVAVRMNSTQVLVSWRLLGLDPAGIGFNVYRSANGATVMKLNSSVLTAGTNYTDTTANLTLSNSYSVRPVINGVEQSSSGSFTLKANNAIEPIVRIPITPPTAGYRSKSIWVGDLDGDGEYDYIVDRLAPFYVDPVTGVENNDIGIGNQFLEAYKRDGTKLWTIDLGQTSRGTYNISPGAATISMGMWDGVTVQDLNGDGKAEVVLKIANGVKFPDGSTFTTTSDQRQFISVLNGMTGNKLAQLEFPSDYSSAGRLSTMLGVGYLDGVTPSIVAWLRNRNANKSFNDIMMAWNWNGSNTITQKWKLPLGAGTTAAQGVAGFHQMRIVDVNGDGCDDVLPGNYAINGKTGTILYKLAGIGHGDRFHVGDFDPDRPGLEGFGIQQNDAYQGVPNAILDYYYDAGTGQILWTDNGVGYDVGRGAAGDVDPSRRGYEVWSFEGIHNGPTHELVDDDSNNGVPWPNLRIWWDGDVGSEELDGTVINKYNPLSKTTGRLVTGYKMGATTNEHFPLFYGDIFGDWREEAVYMNSTWSELTILTTNVPTSTQLYTLPHNPEYRNSMTVKGYVQSHHVDYYLGTGMTTPPTPNIVYADVIPPAIVTSSFNYLTSQISTVTFNKDVTPSITTSANISILNQMTGFTLPSSQFVVSYNSTNNIATITYTGLLADGNYRITFNNIADASGNLLAGTNYVDFFVLAADANHDRYVDTFDQAALALNLNKTGRNFSQGDFDYNGTVNSDDQAVLSGALRKWLPAISPLSLPASGGADIISLKRESATLVDLYASNSTSPLYRIYVSGLGALSFSGGAGADDLTLDFSNGIPFNVNTFVFDGGSENDSLSVIGTTGSDTVAFNSSAITFGATTITDSSNESRLFDGKLGLDAITVSGGPALLFAATQLLSSLILNSGTTGIKSGSNSILSTRSLSISGSALLDLHDNNLVIDYTGSSNPYGTVKNWVKTGLTLFGGTGKGIGSYEVDAQTRLGTALGVVDNSIAGLSGIDGFSLPTKSVIIKYTWFGDSNLDGRINPDDYALIDSGFTSGGALSGWLFGDYDYNGLIESTDYALLDTGFINQSNPL